MTSWTPTEEHPEVAEISDLTEDLLPPEQSARLREHLIGCVPCTEVYDSLREIRDLLGTLPGPAGMPPEVADRIDAALAAESARRADDPEPTIAAAPERHVSRETPPAGSRAVSRETTRPGPRERTATGPGRGGRRRRRLLAALSAVAVLGVGGVVVSAVESGGSTGSTAASTGGPATVETFSGVPLSQRVEQLLGARKRSGPDAPAQAGRNTPFSVQAPVLPACVLKAIAPATDPLASSQGTFRGRTSYLLVLPHPGDPRRVDAYVVDAACAAPGAAGTAAPATVLAKETFLR